MEFDTSDNYRAQEGELKGGVTRSGVKDAAANRGSGLLHRDENFRDGVLPGQLQFAFVTAGAGECHFVGLDGLGRLAHVHLDAAEVLALLVIEPPFARGFAHDQLPLLGIEENEKRVVAFGH